MAAWRPTGRSRERILAYGSTGTGKTYGALTIAAKLPDGDTMFIVDADNTWNRTLETDGATMGVMIREELTWDGRRFVNDETYCDEAGKVVLYRTEGWEAHAAALTDALSRAERNDWVVVDSMTWLWDSVLPWYIEKTHGRELPEFLLEHRVNQVKSGAKETQGQDAVLVEWNYINPLWNRTVASPLVNSNCHLYLVAEAKQMRSDGRVDQVVRQLYERVGWIPATQKRLGHQVQTVLYFTVSKTGEYKVETIKDRGREALTAEPWSDLFSTYLRKTAGWKPTKEG